MLIPAPSHLAVVHAGADDHADLRPVQPQPQSDSDADRQREDEEARERVWTPQTWTSTRRLVHRAGHADDVAADLTAPGGTVLGKCAMIWSATITGRRS
jgi:hypothetical protein